MRIPALIIVTLTCLPPRASAAAPNNDEPAIRIIVNPANKTTTLDRKTVADIFLKRTAFWPNGDLIRPVDLTPDSKGRREFSARILGRSVPSVRNYWQQRIFTGRGVPPPELDSDDQVIEYVARNPDAIGYVFVEKVPKKVRLVRLK